MKMNSLIIKFTVAAYKCNLYDIFLFKIQSCVFIIEFDFTNSAGSVLPHYEKPKKLA